MKKAMSLLLMLALALAIFALPAAAQTHDHDGCTVCAEEIQPRSKTYVCPSCGGALRYQGSSYVSNGVRWYLYACSDCPYSGYTTASPW